MAAEESSAQSRFTDNPFRQPGLSPEQLEWLERRNAATKVLRETGDSSQLEQVLREGAGTPDPLTKAKGLVEQAKGLANS